LTNKERVHAALVGDPVDRMPVTVLTHHLYLEDHFAELTGRPQWEVWKWLYAEPEDYLSCYLSMMEQAPFDMLGVCAAATREQRRNAQIVEREGEAFFYDKESDSLVQLSYARSGHARYDAPPKTQRVFDRADVDEQFKVTTGQAVTGEENDYLEALVEAVGDSEFIMAGGAVGALYSCSWYVGMENLYPMLVEQPDLIDYLCWRITAQNIESFRGLVSIGGDAILIDDATATSDMISLAHYERFSLPYMKAMVSEIHSLGYKAILIYYGGVADRLEQIASIGADGLAVETSMKGYVNDIEKMAGMIGDRVTLFGNIDPIGVLEKGSEAQLEAEIAGQAAVGRKARGFIISTGSPITPGTSLSRVQRFIQLARRYGTCAR